MSRWLPTLVTRRPRAILVLSLLAVVLAAVVGSGAVSRLKGGGFDDPAAASSRAKTALISTFGQPEANLVLLVTAAGGRRVDDPEVAADARTAVGQLRAEHGVTVLGDYWDAAGPAAAGLRSDDGRRGLVLLNIAGTEDTARTRAKELSTAYTRGTPHASLRTGGYQQANVDINSQVTKDLATAESVAIPLTLLLLVVAFGALVAGLVPMLVAGISIVGTFAALYGITLVTDVSIFSLNLTTAMAIGLGVDYSLLIVNRFREELAARGVDRTGGDRATVAEAVAEAVAATLRTAGRTVLFSAFTVAVALSSLLVFPLYFLRSFAYAGVAVVVVAATTSLLTVPALLSVLGPRINAGRIRRRRPGALGAGASGAGALGGGAAGGGALGAGESAFWQRTARLVMARPLLTGLPVVALLLGLGLPFLRVQFGLPDDRVLPASASQARQVGDVLRSKFHGQDSAALSVVLPAVTGPDRAARAGALGGYATELSRLEHVARVDTATGSYLGGRQVAPAGPTAGEFDHGGLSAAWLRVVPSVDPASSTAERLVEQVRAVPSPGVQLVGGPSAQLVDTKSSIGGRLPLAGGLIVVTTFLLLFLFTGSVVIPLKALIINAVSIVGVLGSMAWVFQQGHGASLLGVTPTPLTLTMPLLMFCIAFGLSMDYEVFLLGRIKEQHDAGADTATAVAGGLARTGRIVSTAAALMAITFFAFVTSEVSFLQMFGLGTGLAVVLDATLIRGVLVPALMRLMGSANWWAPAPLRRLHRRIGVSERDTGPAPAVPVASGAAVS
jgi:RND superfamily putative drug exporter